MSVPANLCREDAIERSTAQASVSLTGAQFDLPMRKGTLGPDVVDISTLYQDTGRHRISPYWPRALRRCIGR
jgi:hypothetical protein